METTQTPAIEVLVRLLHEWVDTAFQPAERDVPAMNAMWGALADALCGAHAAERAAFQSELAALRHSERAGDPPTREIDRRLRDLVDVGMREMFLVIAVRQAMDRLIEIHAPATLARWQQIADRRLPAQLQFGRAPEEWPGSRSTFMHAPQG